MNEWTKKMWDIYIDIYKHTMEYYLTIKRRKSYHLQQHDRTRGHYAKWNKSDRERQIPYDLTYMLKLNKTKPKMNS